MTSAKETTRRQKRRQTRRSTCQNRPILRQERPMTRDRYLVWCTDYIECTSNDVVTAIRIRSQHVAVLIPIWKGKRRHFRCYVWDHWCHHLCVWEREREREREREAERERECVYVCIPATRSRFSITSDSVLQKLQHFGKLHTHRAIACQKRPIKCQKWPIQCQKSPITIANTEAFPSVRCQVGYTTLGIYRISYTSWVRMCV